MSRASNIIVDDDFQPEEARKNVASWYTPGLSDGIGDRLLMFDNTSGSSLELLRFKREFANRPQFEDALRQRVAQLERFTHPAIATVRTVQSLGATDGLALVSNQTIGRRLSEVLREARGHRFALELLRQIVPALAALQDCGEDVSHGIITPDRVVVTPEGRLVLVEHVLGSAIESLNIPADRLRLEFGIPVPADAGRRRRSSAGVPLDRRADVLQLGFIALSLMAGREIDPAEYPHKSVALLDELARAADGSSPSLRLLGWLQRALQLGDDPFDSARDAHDALGDVHEPERQLDEPRRSFEVYTSAPALEAVMSPDPIPDFLDEEIPDAAGSPREWPKLDPVRVEAVARPSIVPRIDRSTPPGRPARWIVAALVTAVVAEAAVIGGMIYMRRPTSAAAAGVAAPSQPGVSLVQESPAAAPKTESSADPGAGAALVARGTGAAGRLEVTSDPSGARVNVDGARRGTTPLVIQLAPGPHTVVVSDGTSTSTRTVNIAAGGSATLMTALSSTGAAGWVSINAPLDLQVREGGSLIGVTSADRLMLPVGRHELALSNAAVGFQTTLSVDIQPGKALSTSVNVPNGSLSINALPWANVLLDGRAIGTTPLANLDVPLGSHEVVWRHPQFGERRQTVLVTAKSPVRVVMDLSK